MELQPLRLKAKTMIRPRVEICSRTLLVRAHAVRGRRESLRGERVGAGESTAVTQQRAHGTDRAQINLVRTATQKFLRH